jgi:hypothetical protein
MTGPSPAWDVDSIEIPNTGVAAVSVAAAGCSTARASGGWATFTGAATVRARGRSCGTGFGGDGSGAFGGALWGSNMGGGGEITRIETIGFIRCSSRRGRWRKPAEKAQCPTIESPAQTASRRSRITALREV